jgi:putative addiction module CopG family antidote
MTKLELTLPPALSDFVRRLVDAGLYGSAESVVEDAVRRLSESDDAKAAALRAALAPGLAEADAGIFYPGTMDDIIAEARAAAAARK